MTVLVLLSLSAVITVTYIVTDLLSCAGPRPWTVYVFTFGISIIACAVPLYLARARFRHRPITYPRLYWISAVIVSFGMWLIPLPASVESYTGPDLGSDSRDHPPSGPIRDEQRSFDLLQQPWLIHRAYMEVFHSAFHNWHRAIDKFSSILRAFLSVLAPIATIFALRELWLVQRRTQ